LSEIHIAILADTRQQAMPSGGNERWCFCLQGLHKPGIAGRGHRCGGENGVCPPGQTSEESFAEKIVGYRRHFGDIGCIFTLKVLPPLSEIYAILYETSSGSDHTVFLVFSILSVIHVKYPGLHGQCYRLFRLQPSFHLSSSGFSPNSVRPCIFGFRSPTPTFFSIFPPFFFFLFFLFLFQSLSS